MGLLLLGACRHVLCSNRNWVTGSEQSVCHLKHISGNWKHLRTFALFLEKINIIVFGNTTFDQIPFKEKGIYSCVCACVSHCSEIVIRVFSAEMDCGLVAGAIFLGVGSGWAF